MLPAIAAKTGVNFFSISKNLKQKLIIDEGSSRDNEILRIDLMRPITAGSNIGVEKKAVP
jgi:hypothetical protein